MQANAWLVQAAQRHTQWSATQQAAGKVVAAAGEGGRKQRDLERFLVAAAERHMAHPSLPPIPHLPTVPCVQAFGEVRSLYAAAKARGFVVVSYFDTRAATLAKHTLSGQALGGQQLDVHFSLPKDDREASQVGVPCRERSLLQVPVSHRDSRGGALQVVACSAAG